MIDKLRSIRDRISDVFTSSINKLEPDARSAPAPREERAANQRKELEKLTGEVRQTHEQLQQMLEEIHDLLDEDEDEVYYQSFGYFVDDLKIDEDLSSET